MAEDDGFIGLPPGILPPSIDADSGTVRRERPERRRAERSEIVFFPVGAGVVPSPTPAGAESVEAPPVPVAVAPATASSEIDDATRASIRRHSVAAWRLVIEEREPLLVEGTVLLGRNPVVTERWSGARAVPLDDASKSISKTHAALEIESGVLYVHDLDSTNGVWVVHEGEDAIEVAPGTRAAVPAGAELELGDFVIRVEHG